MGFAGKMRMLAVYQLLKFSAAKSALAEAFKTRWHLSSRVMRKQTSEELWGNRTLGDFLRIKNFNRIAIHLKFRRLSPLHTERNFAI